MRFLTAMATVAIFCTGVSLAESPNEWEKWKGIYVSRDNTFYIQIADGELSARVPKTNADLHYGKVRIVGDKIEYKVKGNALRTGKITLEGQRLFIEWDDKKDLWILDKKK